MMISGRGLVNPSCSHGIHIKDTDPVALIKVLQLQAFEPAECRKLVLWIQKPHGVACRHGSELQQDSHLVLNDEHSHSMSAKIIGLANQS